MTQPRIPTRQEMPAIWAGFIADARDNPLPKQSPEQAEMAAMRALCLRDLYFLLTQVLSCGFLFEINSYNQDWLYDRVREVEGGPNGHLDLWAREHMKTTVISFGLTIQDILYDPEITVGIFSVTRKLALKILIQIKNEFEKNELLRGLFPDIVWEKPDQQSPKWSEETGIVLKRTGNPGASTVEAWGLIEGMPTGKHFNIRVYDDIINQEHVTTEDQIKKATSAWELSLNLGSSVPTKRYSDGDIVRYIGTRYHVNDPYAEVIRRKAAVPRIHPGTVEGKEDGDPVFWGKKLARKKRRDYGPFNWSCQILQNPLADRVQGFDENWLMYWEPQNLRQMNLYLLVDPANSKNKRSDYTTMGVIALSSDQNYRVVAGIRKRMNLTERTKALFEFHEKFRPKAVGYEHYGMQADIQHIQYVQSQKSYNFAITSLGGNMPKLDRIRRLIPIMEQGRFFLPETCYFVDEEKQRRDFTKQFVSEMNDFPVGAHDDILDMAARILDDDLHAEFPVPSSQAVNYEEQVSTDRGNGVFWGDMPSQNSYSFNRNLPQQNLIELDDNGYVSKIRSPEQAIVEHETFEEVMWRSTTAS